MQEVLSSSQDGTHLFVLVRSTSVEYDGIVVSCSDCLERPLVTNRNRVYNLNSRRCVSVILETLTGLRAGNNL